MSKPKAKSNRSRKPARKAQAKSAPKAKQATSLTAETSSDCPYRSGTLYANLFVEANKDYIGKAELITRVAELTGKSEKVVNFAYQVLKSKTHRSNKNRSTELTEGDKVKLVAIRK